MENLPYINQWVQKYKAIILFFWNPLFRALHGLIITCPFKYVPLPSSRLFQLKHYMEKFFCWKTFFLTLLVSQEPSSASLLELFFTSQIFKLPNHRLQKIALVQLNNTKYLDFFNEKRYLMTNNLTDIQNLSISKFFQFNNKFILKSKLKIYKSYYK